MRSSRMPEQAYRKQGGGAGKAFVVILLLCACVFVFVALTAGNWLNDNVVTPVLNFFSGESAASPMPSAQASAKTSERINDAVTLDEKPYYYLQGGIFSDMANAVGEAKALKERGGAGYILEEDGKQRVLLAAYDSEADAKTIRDRLEKEQSMQTYVYSVKIPSFSITLGAGKEQVTAIKDAFALPEYAIRTLMDISEGFDKAEDLSALMSELKDKSARVAAEVADALPQNDPNESINALREYCDALNAQIQKLPGNLSNKDMEISSELKYNVIWLIDEYRQFVDKLS